MGVCLPQTHMRMRGSDTLLLNAMKPNHTTVVDIGSSFHCVSHQVRVLAWTEAMHYILSLFAYTAL